MKSFVAILALVAVAAADVSHLQPRSPEYDAQTLKEVNEVGPESFGYAFETSNGISAQESGALRVLSPESAAIVVQGANSHTAPTGEQIALTYIADENGYQPQGAHLPTPPPPQEIPEYILRAIEYIRANPPKPEQPKRI